MDIGRFSATVLPAPAGAKDCSHGWSGAAALPQAAQPVERRRCENEFVGAPTGVMDQAVIEILSGTEPSGLLPLQMPASMETVEAQAEDVPHDMKVHVDSEGNAYDFAFGLNWKGVISDARVERYKRKTVSVNK